MKIYAVKTSDNKSIKCCTMSEYIDSNIDIKEQVFGLYNGSIFVGKIVDSFDIDKFLDLYNKVEEKNKLHKIIKIGNYKGFRIDDLRGKIKYYMENDCEILSEYSPDGIIIGNWFDKNLSKCKTACEEKGTLFERSIDYKDYSNVIVYVDDSEEVEEVEDEIYYDASIDKNSTGRPIYLVDLIKRSLSTPSCGGILLFDKNGLDRVLRNENLLSNLYVMVLSEEETTQLFIVNLNEKEIKYVGKVKHDLIKNAYFGNVFEYAKETYGYDNERTGKLLDAGYMKYKDIIRNKFAEIKFVNHVYLD